MSPHSPRVFTVALRGTNWGEEAESRARCQYLIGINDPMTGVVKLHPVDHVFALAMQVLGSDNDENNIKSELFISNANPRVAFCQI